MPLESLLPPLPSWRLAKSFDTMCNQASIILEDQAKGITEKEKQRENSRASTFVRQILHTIHERERKREERERRKESDLQLCP